MHICLHSYNIQIDITPKIIVHTWKVLGLYNNRTTDAIITLEWETQFLKTWHQGVKGKVVPVL